MMFGILSIGLFQADIYFPIWLSVLIFVGISVYIIQQFMMNRQGILVLLLWLIYALPFNHIVPYLWFDFGVDNPSTLWGLAVNPYMLDEQIISLTAMIGAVGGLGFLLGISLNRNKIVKEASLSIDANYQAVRTLSVFSWFIWVFVGVALSWLAAPQNTIFRSAYTDSESLLHGANFGSAWMISYALLAFAFCDSILEREAVKKLLKQCVILLAIGFVVVYLQLLRGDRESLPFIVGMLLVYYYWAVPYIRRKKTNFALVKILLGLLLLVLLSMAVGIMRSSLVDVTNFEEVTSLLDISNLFYGTWSGALLTPLSVAGDHINDVLSLKLGQTYMDFVLSIPPGFIVESIGYSRPINGLSGPAWEMRYGIGGTHASVVPFMDFRMIGVFFITSFWAYIFTCIEKRAMVRLSVVTLSLLCIATTVAPHWLWYGEKYVINSLIIWVFLAFLYRVRMPRFRSYSVCST